ncbi:hypothetical protein DRP77_01000 [Candidatus Poribacteria bacterium]|nr:MAG: hypothetical protein DRP77_01000 [Candidatus Poribacteria bacterium]
MTPRERLLKTLRGEKADRVPIHLLGFNLPDREAIASLAEAKKLVEGRMTLGGNEVERAVRAAFEGGKERMVLQTTEGPLAPLMSERMRINYRRMIDVWEELSEID